MKRFGLHKENELFSDGFFSKRDIHCLLLPLIAEQFLSYLVGLLDSVMVSSARESAVAAVSLVDSVSILIINVFAAFATGGAIVAGQYLGSADGDSARKTGHQMLFFLGITSIVVTVILEFFSAGILHSLFGHADAAIKEDCRVYYQITMYSVPFIALYNGGTALFRTTGNSTIPMRISVIMNLINVAGNAVLIYGCKMGVAGVAIPTVFSRFIAMALFLILASRREEELSLRGLWYNPQRIHSIGKVLKMGIPGGIENGIFQMGKILLFSMVSTLPAASVTANAVGNTVSTIQCVVGLSVNLGIVSVVSRCAGAGNYRHARQYLQYMLRYMYIVQGIVCLLSIIAIPWILKIYNVSAETGRLAAGIILIHGIAMITIWPLAFGVNTGMRAAGDVKFTMIVAVSSMWICRVGLGYVFTFLLKWGVWGIWYAWIIDWICRIAFFIPRYIGHKWEDKSVIKMHGRCVSFSNRK